MQQVDVEFAQFHQRRRTGRMGRSGLLQNSLIWS